MKAVKSEKEAMGMEEAHVSHFLYFLLNWFKCVDNQYVKPSYLPIEAVLPTLPMLYLLFK